MKTQNIIPYLWFDNNAEEAINFYTSIFPDVKMGKIIRNGDAGPGPKGSVLTASFQLNGLEFVALNGGPQFKFTEAVSFMVECKTQEEVDGYWEKLSEGGEKSQCGWLKDKFGLSWQIVPAILIEMLEDRDAGKSQQVMQAMMKMQKIEIAALQQAYDQ